MILPRQLGIAYTSRVRVTNQNARKALSTVLVCTNKSYTELNCTDTKCLNDAVRVATGQEMIREKIILQGQGKVREFHFN